jgi:hypothetical protein
VKRRHKSEEEYGAEEVVLQQVLAASMADVWPVIVLSDEE